MEHTKDRSNSYLKSTYGEHLICWRTAAAGVLVTLLAYMILSALGAGVGGFTASHIIEKGGNGSGLSAAEGVWMAASAMIAVFLGSYYAVRYSHVTHKQVAACRAILIASIFFLLLLNIASSTFGSFAEVALSLGHPNAVSEADAAAKNIGDAGWLLFITLVGGLVTAVIGGIEGSIGNLKRPFGAPSTVETVTPRG